MAGLPRRGEDTQAQIQQNPGTNTNTLGKKYSREEIHSTTALKKSGRYLPRMRAGSRELISDKSNESESRPPPPAAISFCRAESKGIYRESCISPFNITVSLFAESEREMSLREKG
jgi:hypothetical protein